MYRNDRFSAYLGSLNVAHCVNIRQARSISDAPWFPSRASICATMGQILRACSIVTDTEIETFSPGKISRLSFLRARVWTRTLIFVS